MERIIISLEVDDKDLAPTIKKLEGLGKVSKENAKDFNNSANEFKKSVNSTKSTLADFKSFAVSALSLTALIGSLKQTVSTLKEFEKSLSELSAITGATGKDLDFFAGQALRLGATTTASAKEAVDAFKLIGSAKPELLKAKEGLVAVAESAIILSEASGLSLVDSSNALTTVMNQFNLTASESTNVINTLAAGSKEGAAAIPQLKDAIQAFGVQAKSAGVSVEETVAIVETLAEKGIQGAEAGTKLRNVLTILNTAKGLPKEAVSQLEAYGVNLDIVTDKHIPLNQRLREFSKISGDATALVKVFGRENAVAGQIVLENVDSFERYTEAVTGTNVAYEQAEIMTDNLSGDLDRLNSALEAMTLEGSGLNDLIRLLTQLGTSVIQGLTVGFNDLSESMEFFTNVATKGFDFAVNASNLKKYNDEVNNQVSLLNKAGEGSLMYLERFKEQGKTVQELQEDLKNVNHFLNQNIEVTSEMITFDKEGTAQKANMRAQLILMKQALEERLMQLDKEKESTIEIVDGDKEENKEKKEKIHIYSTLANNVSNVLQLQKELRAELEKPIWQQSGEKVSAYRKEIEKLNKENEELASNISITAQKLEEMNDPQFVDFGETFAEKLTISARALEKHIELINQLTDITNLIIEINDTKFEKELQQNEIRREQDLNEAERRITSERDLADAQARIEEESERRRIAIQRRQAKSEQNQAIFNAIINGGVAATKTAAQLGFPVALPFIALALAQTALQVGLIKSQPLPAFKKGTKYSPEGLALVGEEGRELMIHNGKASLTPNGPSVVNLKKGTQILPNLETEYILKSMNIKGIEAPKEKEVIDYRKLGRILKQESNRQLIVNMDENGFSKHLIGKASNQRILNSKLNFN